jgi:hypothetical protein
VNHSLQVIWRTDSVKRRAYLDRYPGLTGDVKTRENDDTHVDFTVTGPLATLALWVLREHCDNDLETALEVLKMANPDACHDERCNRCGRTGMAKTPVTLCEDCDFEVTSVQATALLEIQEKLAPVTFTANPKRTQL